MKNIFLLSTDKPSRIIKSQDNDFILLNTDAPNWLGINLKTTKQHIYITSNSKFVRDEYITDGIEVIKATPKLVDAQGLVDRREWKKIILTTDQDLIKDGVQAIDDEFLEWFVKNPSCEYVEVNKVSVNCSCANQSGYRDNANVILENSTCHLRNNCKTKHKIIIPKEEPKQDLPIVNGSYGCTIQTKKQESKQETLEEAASRCAIQENKSSLYELGMKYFQLGAKWQAERMYSEEEVVSFIHKFIKEHQPQLPYLIGGINMWFKQFKKK